MLVLQGDFWPVMVRIFEWVKDHPSQSIYEIAKNLEVDYKNVYQTVKFCEKYGFVTTNLVLKNKQQRREVSVDPKLLGLDLTRVSIERGAKLLAAKEKRRKEFFRNSGRMECFPSEEARPLIVLRKKPFVP